MIWLRTLFFAVTFVATTLVLVPSWIVRRAGPPRLAGGALGAAGVLLLAAGVALMLWCWRDFAVRGRGTPAPFDPPRRLVIAGPYRYVRNPMYLAAELILLGQAALFAVPALVGYAALFGLAAHAFVVGYEERALAHRFGEEYAEYRATVPRWVPRKRGSRV